MLISFQVTDIKRVGFSKSVDVKFYITDNNRTVSAKNAAKTFSSISAKQLGDALTYKVITNLLIVRLGSGSDVPYYMKFEKQVQHDQFTNILSGAFSTYCLSRKRKQTIVLKIGGNINASLILTLG